MSDLIFQFQKDCPDLVEQMEKNTHHFSRTDINPYHREGGVWTHVNMVCLMAEMLKVPDTVKVAALLHDVGKPLSTKIDTENKKVKMYGHEGLSVFLALNFLNSLNLSESDKVRVLELIALHTTLYKAIRNKETFDQVIVDQFKGSPDLLMNLIDLSACDALGRFMEGDEQREFWENAQDTLMPLVFKADTPFIPRSTEGEAIILVGPPNSGKTTWVKQHAPNHTVVSRDDVILQLAKTDNYTEAWYKVDQDKVNAEYDLQRKEKIKTSNQLVFDLTHMTEKSRTRSLQGLPKNLKRTAVVFFTPYEVLKTRDVVRSKKENKTIPHYVLVNMMGSFQVPLLSEGFDEIKYVFS